MFRCDKLRQIFQIPVMELELRSVLKQKQHQLKSNPLLVQFVLTTFVYAAAFLPPWRSIQQKPHRHRDERQRSGNFQGCAHAHGGARS